MNFPGVDIDFLFPRRAEASSPVRLRTSEPDCDSSAVSVSIVAPKRAS